MNILKINNLNYGKFHSFNLTIEGKKVVSVIGPNMCGKTTLFRVLSGVIPTSNCVSINDVPLNKTNVNNYIKNIGVVFSYRDNCFLKETVIDEIIFCLNNLGYDKSYIDYLVDDMFNRFFFNVKDKKISELTIMEKQKLLIIMALFHSPKLLIIDDDVLNNFPRDEAINIIKILKRFEQLTIIVFGCNFDYACKSDFVYIIENGEIKLEDMYPNVLKESKLIQSIGLELPFTELLKEKLSNDELIMMELISEE